MKHQVTYKNAPSDWNEALPLGNSVFGGMTYFKENSLTLAMNHYEVYYKKHYRYSEAYRHLRKQHTTKMGDGTRYQKLVELADNHYSNYKEEAIYNYFETLFKHSSTYGHDLRGVSHMPTGEIAFKLNEDFVEESSFSLRLLVEEARVELKVEEAKDKLKIEGFVTKEKDYFLFDIEQTQRGLLESITMSYPRRRYQREFISSFHQLSEDRFYYTVSFYPDGEDQETYEPFKFIVMLGIEGGKGIGSFQEDRIEIKLYDTADQMTMITHVITTEQSKNLLQDATNHIKEGLKEKEILRKNHQSYWTKFFSKSRVTLPDKFLENLWYINLYALGCCSGKNGKMYPDASGLNGLWDIKQPNVWGSSWYWDVNIQATYWPIYTANHLELSEVFIDALLFYTWDMEKLAKEGYGVEGYAMDYPHMLYNSILPWCAQWLWWHYEYKKDLIFLREKAYPFFKNLLKFITQVIRWDKEKQVYYFYPEVSPEQGPLTRNATITLSTVKYLLEITLKSIEILGVQEDEEKKWEEIVNHLAPYPLGKHPTEGEIIRDSEYAIPNLHLRHPSLLMPIYPIGEINQYSEEGIREIAENTLRYVEKQSEIGVFIFGWLACAAARMGKGDMALRVLYQRGLDHMLRANGLCAEETERWNNFCLIGKPPLYYPCVMEATGEVVATVNEILLQSYDGVIDIFPAVPRGIVEKQQLLGMHQHNIENEILHYGSWTNCSFSKLLAKGGFEVTSQMLEGRVHYVHVLSQLGEQAKIRITKWIKDLKIYHLKADTYEEVLGMKEHDVLIFTTERGEEYLLALAEEIEEIVRSRGWIEQDKEGEDEEVIYTHMAHTYRRVFIGKDAHTEYIKALDGMSFEYCLGNIKRSNPSTYRFDFGCGSSKDYSHTLHRQVYEAGKIGLGFQRIMPEDLFSVYKGYGFKEVGHISAKDREIEDILRTDFVEGEKETTFLVEVTKGKYDIFVVCGDEKEGSYTEITIDSHLKVQPERRMKKGQYFYETIPIMIKEDKYLEIKIGTRDNDKWKLNMLIINRIHSL